MAASEVSRAFSSALDSVADGETIVITRGGRRVATLGPASGATWGDLRAAMADWQPSGNPEFGSDIESAREALAADEDPWQIA